MDIIIRQSHKLEALRCVSCLSIQKKISQIEKEKQDILKARSRTSVKDEHSLLPDTCWWSLISGHNHHLETFHAISELTVLLREALVSLLKVCNVLGCLAEDGGLVELVGWGKAAEILVGIVFHALNAGLFQAVDHDA